jgi:hypothetical protein
LLVPFSLISLEVDHRHQTCAIDIGYGEFQQCRTVLAFELRPIFSAPASPAGSQDAHEILLAIDRQAQRDLTSAPAKRT